MTLVIILPLLTLLHGFLTSIVTEPSPFGEHRPWCSMTPTTSKIAEKKNILPMEIYNLARCSIYNDQTVEKKTNITT